MDSMFDELTNFMTDNKDIIDTYESDMKQQGTDIINVEPEIHKTVKEPKKSYKRIKPTRVSNNLLTYEPSITQNLFEEDYLMTAMINTTNTLEGKLNNLTFKEEDMIKICYYTDDIIDISCNYGNVRHPDYHFVKKVNKKKNKLKKRKEQGDGTEFNSQITFTIKSGIVGLMPYKFKVFRPGQIQLPGAKIYAIDDIIRCSRLLTEYINTIYKRTDITLDSLSAVMKNYKCVVKLPNESTLNLSKLTEILLAESEANGIFMVKYSRQDSKAAIVFNTPTPTDRDKRLRLNVFMSGKINILGAYDEVYTRSTYRTIYNTIQKHYNDIVIYPNSTRYAWTYNVSAFEPDSDNLGFD
jgi:TATA-box binding protein (TBP) (component of TFIID and TFIIIB)